MFKIDKLSYDNGLTYVSPYLKLCVGISGLVLSLATEKHFVHAIIFAFYFLLIVFAAKIPAGDYMKLFRIPFGFIVMGVIAMVIGISYDASKLFFPFGVGKIYVGFSKSGFHSALLVISRCISAISATYFCSLTTPVNQFVSVMKKIKVPRVFVEQFILIYRFINLFSEELNRLQIAMELKHGFTNRRVWVRSVSNIASVLFFCVMGSYRAWEDALELKLFDGEFYY